MTDRPDHLKNISVFMIRIAEGLQRATAPPLSVRRKAAGTGVAVNRPDPWGTAGAGLITSATSDLSARPGPKTTKGNP